MRGKRVSNLHFSKTDEVFKECCRLSNTEATKRQASKYRRGKGKSVRWMKIAVPIVNQRVINRSFDNITI